MPNRLSGGRGSGSMNDQRPRIGQLAAGAGLILRARLLNRSVCRFVGRFSDAGSDDLTTRYGGRRPKSAKARNRGKFERYRAAGYGEPRAMGIWARSLSWAMAAAALDLAWKQCRADCERLGRCLCRTIGNTSGLDSRGRMQGWRRPAASQGNRIRNSGR